MPGDAASATSPEDKKRYFGCPCVNDTVDVDSRSTDGRTYTLSIGQVPVAQLVVNNVPAFSITRSWGPRGGTTFVEVVATFDGSAQWLEPNLNSVQVKNLGQHGRVTLQCAGAPPARTFGDPVDVPRTSPINSARRQDRIALCNATTIGELNAAATPMDVRVAAAANITSVDLRINSTTVTIQLPSQGDIASTRNDIVDLNNAIDSGDFVTAGTIASRLDVPFPEGPDGHVDATAFSAAQWNTACAIGAVTMQSIPGNRVRTGFNAGAGVMTAMHGTGHYVALINDMAERGVPGLSAPPTFDQIQKYYQNVLLEESHQSRDVVAQKLLEACQRVMAGMQVHYRLAGNQDPEWGPNTVIPIVLYIGNMLVEERGRAHVFATQADAAAFTPPAAGGRTVPVAPGGRARVTRRANRLTVTINNPQEPEGYADSVSRGVWGRRYESDCDGMASFRLRTLPPLYAPVGTVSGSRRTGGIGHVVAVFSSPGGLYLSSNGKVPIRVAGTSGLQSAIEAEFAAIYAGHPPASAFDFGFGIGPSPGNETPAQREPIVDRIMLEGAVDESLRRAARTMATRRRAPLDWNNFIPQWLSP
jgi:hypothetical protein